MARGLWGGGNGAPSPAGPCFPEHQSQLVTFHFARVSTVLLLQGMGLEHGQGFSLPQNLIQNKEICEGGQEQKDF